MILREMLVDDLDQVMEIEEELFSVPWTKEGFLTFLMKENGMFLVVEEKGRILGYCGLLTVLDEGDVTNVAVRRDRQREGIGNFLMESMIRLAEERGITMIHLEVRAGNETAIRLYERQGFVRDGLRKGYYTDPTEDAVLMTVHDLQKCTAAPVSFCHFQISDHIPADPVSEQIGQFLFHGKRNPVFHQSSNQSLCFLVGPKKKGRIFNIFPFFHPVF